MKPAESFEHLQRIIVGLRGQRVILDADLAALYGVENRVLLQAVKRNLERFPADFMFQLTREEATILRSQTVILRLQTPEITQDLPSGPASFPHGKHLKYLPYAFTEQGVAMLSTVLRSRQAIEVNIEIMRAFVRLRQMLATHSDLLEPQEWMRSTCSS